MLILGVSATVLSLFTACGDDSADDDLYAIQPVTFTFDESDPAKGYGSGHGPSTA